MRQSARSDGICPRQCRFGLHRGRWVAKIPPFKDVKTGTTVSVRTRIEATLREHGVTPTAQRIEVSMLLLAEPCHKSADQILQALRSSGSRVSKATVYNTLNLLSSKGILKAISLDPTRIVYDSTTAVHHHFLNEDTGELMDIDSSQVELQRLPILPPGMRAESVELIIRVRPDK